MNNIAGVESVNRPPKRYKTTLPESFSTDHVCVVKFEEIIDELLHECNTLDELDNAYDKYVRTYHEEVAKHLRILDSTPMSKKLARHSPKPYWSD